jgi:uncharacterized sporulation protein YeaH/YhbH (DUF444 family)
VDGDAGTEPGHHILEVEVTLDDLAAILGEELELPRVQPRGRRSVPVEKVKYSNIRRVGPESLRHFKRTFREALKRQVALGLYNPGNPLIVPIREDRRYRSWHVREVPESNAVIILCMDVSGSMGDQQKEIVRVASFWIDTWLRSQYKNLENVYVVHEAFAKEVDQHTFYHLRESGGTKISTAYELINAAIDSRFSPDSWNVYLFHFSDGENGDSRDTDQCMELLRKELLPKLNLFCFGQVRSSYGGGRADGCAAAPAPRRGWRPARRARPRLRGCGRRAPCPARPPRLRPLRPRPGPRRPLPCCRSGSAGSRSGEGGWRRCACPGARSARPGSGTCGIPS